MKHLLRIAALGWFCISVGRAGNPLASFDGAKWIWIPAAPGQSTSEYPAAAHCFRATVELPETAWVQSAELAITADNLYTLYLNGRPAGQSDLNPNAWNRPRRLDVASLLRSGPNVLAVDAANTAPGPAGLLVKWVIRLSDDREIVLVSDGSWKGRAQAEPDWEQLAFDDHHWPAVAVLGDFGVAPWGKFAIPATAQPAGLAPKGDAASGGFVEKPPPDDFRWPEGLVFLGGDCSLYRPPTSTGTRYDSLSVTVFTARKSRAYPEHDLPAPIKVGHRLYVQKPARPDVIPRLLLDAGPGAIGSPSVSFDGRWIYLTMARGGDAFYHIYRLPAAGGQAEQLTRGPFHDIDPAELPDGRIVFTSTRRGTFEEYHSPPSRALFVMDGDGRNLRPITSTIIFDNEPEVLADGRLLFIRSDNFFDRGKVETRLHAIHPDGTEGYTEFGLDLGPEYGSRLRSFYCGSPAPMPDGRVAFVSGPGLTIGWPGSAAPHQQHIGVHAGDVAALPDGRLLCTVPRQRLTVKTVQKQRRFMIEEEYQKIGVLDPQDHSGQVVMVYSATNGAVHSPVYLGARPRPPRLVEKTDPRAAEDVRATGFLFCQNARFTKNTTAGWPHVRALRVLAAQGLTVRSSHGYIVHAGSEVVELGTVPLAPDGSFFIEVPADTPIAFQAVDAEGRSELNEMSWIYVRPGERRGCVGCHQPRQSAPLLAAAAPQAMGIAPLKLLGQGKPHRFRGNNAAVTGLMELQFDRYREVAGLNRHAATADPLATSAQEVRHLIEQFDEGDARNMISAAQRLAIFRDRAAAPALAWLLREGNREARVAAALALATCGTRASVPPLRAALADPDALVAQAAAMALENLTGHAEAYNPFAAFKRRRPQIHQWEAWLQGHSWDAIERGLIQRLDHADRNVVRRAAVALGHVGGRAARAALRQYVEREWPDNPYPQWRKQHHGDNTRFNALARVNPRPLQAATRSLGYLRDPDAVPLLKTILDSHCNPTNANLFLAEAAVEALGRIGTPAAESILIETFRRLEDYHRYVGWYGDHSALHACHASPLHYLITENLDALGCTKAAALAPQFIRSVPTDPDRALFPANDDCETLVGRVLRRNGAESRVVETCLALLGDAAAKRDEPIARALAATHQAWAGKPGPENRAAQMLSLVCRNPKFEPRIRAAFERYWRRPDADIPRVFDTGIPVVERLPVKNWVCFFLARALGNLSRPESRDALLTALAQSPPEAAQGRPDPLGPGVLFLHNALTPCWRAAVAWALGRMGDRRATPVLLGVVRDLKNAPDVRHAAAVALGQLADPSVRNAVQQLAADYPDMATRRALQETLIRLPAPAATRQSAPATKPTPSAQSRNRSQRLVGSNQL